MAWIYQESPRPETGTRGQEFDVLKLLIVTVFAAAVMGLIVQIIQQYGSLNEPYTAESLKDALKSVIDSQGTQTIRRPNMVFEENATITAAFFEKTFPQLMTGGVKICTGSPSTFACTSTTSCTAKKKVRVDVEVCKNGVQYIVLIAGASSCGSTPAPC